ncbi:MAG: (4Fe-4S)-binding protein [Bacteroidota bacterium]|nr:MAG: (4Fe-4S)-binding protein [Bacteroidota bacterium]
MEENNREYTNGEITVYWRPKECVHATTCFRELRSVFDPGKRPWVNMKGASTEEIIRIVNLCPTDALTYKYNQVTAKPAASQQIHMEEKNDSSPLSVEVRVMRDGPLVVKGEFKVTGADGQEMKKMRIASFCRCGHSNNMPYCDGTHRKIGWASD